MARVELAAAEGIGLRERVALVQFWTHTCINRLWTLPFVRAWHEKYTRFESEIDNVRRGARDLRVGYPVVIDSDYTIWTAFGNHYGRRCTSWFGGKTKRLRRAWSSTSGPVA
jgi:hypothetical protein